MSCGQAGCCQMYWGGTDEFGGGMRRILGNTAQKVRCIYRNTTRPEKIAVVLRHRRAEWSAADAARCQSRLMARSASWPRSMLCRHSPWIDMGSAGWRQISRCVDMQAAVEAIALSKILCIMIRFTKRPSGTFNSSVLAFQPRP